MVEQILDLELFVQAAIDEDGFRSSAERAERAERGGRGGE